VGPAIEKASLSPELADEHVEGMLQEADAVLATTARLIAELEVLLDEGRQLPPRGTPWSSSGGKWSKAQAASRTSPAG